jgi:exodeoxyribonuclease III
VSIWHWNINGLNAILERGDLQEFLKKADPTIICFNEIKVDVEKMDKMNYHKQIPSEYEQFWNFCRVKKGYAGTAILTKVKPISVTYDLGIAKHDGEGRVVTAEFKEFILVETYVPNSGDGLSRLKYRVDEWDRDFQAYLHKLRNDKHKPVIITGDLNVAHQEIDVFDPKGKEKIAGYTPQERESFDKFLKEGFVDTFRHFHPEKKQFSFWSARSGARKEDKGWRLDYFLINKEHMGMVTDSSIHGEY